MFVDASILVAILLQAPSAPLLAKRLESCESGVLVTNVIAVWEVVAAVRARKLGSLSVVQAKVGHFINSMRIEILPITPPELGHALNAFDLYGRHRYANPRDRNKGLNLADCFHYASAKALRIPIFALDEGFALTDVRVVRAE